MKLGWTKADVERLPLKPTAKLTEQQTTEVVETLRQMFSQMKDSPFLMGMDTSDMRDLSGEIWMYKGARLGGNLVIRDGKVVDISFTEEGTKAQMNETMQRLL